MEYADKENMIDNVPYINEENTSTSENLDSQTTISENIEPSTSSSNETVSDINSVDEQHISDVGHSISETATETVTETNSECVEPCSESFDDQTAKLGSEDLQLNENAIGASELETVTEGIIPVTKADNFQEYVPVSQEGGSQITEYEGEFVIDQSENKYIPQVQNLDSSEELQSNVDDNQGNNVNVPDNSISEEESNIPDLESDTPDNTPTQITSGILNEQETIETNDVTPENSVNQADTENWTQSEATSDQLISDNVKHELQISQDTNTEEEIRSQTEDENISNETSIEENIQNLLEESETVEKDSEESVNSHEVKQEINSVTVAVSDSVTGEQGISSINESVIHEQIVTCNDEMAENTVLTDLSAVPPESISIDEITERVDDVIQEGDYTIIEGPNSLAISTNQVDESGNSEETWVLLENYDNPEDNPIETVTEQHKEDTYLGELRTGAVSRQSVSSQSSENKPRRGRKPTYDIPMHVLGHDISKPVESVPNGRALPKPRLGVKVPYRNLTSQIVSKAEIEKEVMDRSRLKQEQANSRADILFARKLTQRLARKIAPSPDPPKKNSETKKSKNSSVTVQKKVTEAAVEERKEAENTQSEDNSKIHNDSDLLAILEGEGEEMPVLPKEVPQPQVEDSNLKMLEREIALQQLQELPHQAPKHRIYKGHHIKFEANAPVLIAQASALLKNKSSDKSRESTSNQNSKSTEDQGVLLSDKENETTKRSSRETASVSPKKDNAESLSSPKKHPVDIEPQVKVNMVLKTYSRKRKTIELPEALMESPQPKKMLAENEIKTEKSEGTSPATVYVTKSSRVIKKKVIWDPDETPTRSPKAVAKPDAPSPKPIAQKPVKPVEKVLHSEKVAEKKVVAEKVVKEKVVEKKAIEKSPPKKIATVSSEKKVLVSKGKAPIKNKKTRSEVDKLLMDEGAVKMLYDLKNNDEAVSKKKKDVYSVEKAHKEIMKKANEIKSDLQQNTSNESPKSLRKKESFTPSPVKPAQIAFNAERKMSKDSTRSSLHTPPGSPAYSFPHSQSSMLVRRRSSSSISSSDEVDENDATKISRKRSLTGLDVPKSKKPKKSEASEVEEIAEAKDALPETPPVENKIYSYKSFTVKKTSKHVTVDLNYANEHCYCTIQVLDELTSALKKFGKEKDCHVVTITSSSKAFCLGLDYSHVINEDQDVRLANATELAEKVRDFLLCLLKFPKVLVAGIQGDCAGLGVTMLPLFDMVIASDTATFSTPYARLGCVAEAGFLLSPPTFTNHGLAAELLYSTQKITADDAFRRGLVTRLCWPEKYNETLKNIVVSVSRGSKQSLVATKKQLRRLLLQTTESSINSDSKLFVEHWTSAECQRNFAQMAESVVE